MARKLLTILALAGCAVAALPAGAAEARSRAPKVTKVSPLIVPVGRTLYVRGRNFAPRNTVIFQRRGGRAVFVRVKRRGRTKLVFRIPARVRTLLSKDERGVEQPTTLRLRVVGRITGRVTSLRLSPTVRLPDGPPPQAEAEADCDGDGARNSADADDDNDLLGDAVELDLGLDGCLLDTDRDGSEDGWEYWSAKDLNRRAVPYPGKRPYPNPLDASDGGVDFDGDSLTSAEEHAAWRYADRVYDESLAGSGPQSPLSYSDGTQTSRPNESPAVPAWRSGHYGLSFTPPPYPAILDLDGDGTWQDDERDADSDGLGNWHETHGPAHRGWWEKKLADEAVQPWPQSYYGHFAQRPFADPSFVDPDSDGDTLLDGEDDQDDDDTPNVWEMLFRERADGRKTNPFNPCAPDESRTCPRYRPLP